MWLSAAPGGVFGGDAVGVAVIWIWCRPPCECGRLSFPSASASTRRRRLMPLGWREARNDHLDSQMIQRLIRNLRFQKLYRFLHIYTRCRACHLLFFFENWRVFFWGAATSEVRERPKPGQTAADDTLPVPRCLYVKSLTARNHKPNSLFTASERAEIASSPGFWLSWPERDQPAPPTADFWLQRKLSQKNNSTVHGSRQGDWAHGNASALCGLL